MKVIFLDFDGVLNSVEYWRRGSHRDANDTSLMLDPAAVGLVNQIVRRTGAKVVISSSWRILPSMRANEALNRCGFIGDIIGETPNLRDGVLVRGHEIQAWLDAHPEVKAFVILDDDSDMAHLAGNLVKTVHAVGITQANADAAVLTLGGPPVGAL